MGKIAFLFPGQGSQYVGMGKTLYDEFNIAKQVFNEANEILGIDISKICFEGSISELNELEIMLPAILTVSVSAFRVYMHEIGVIPEYLAGHSLGEYSALTCSGVLSFSDALKIVKLRSILAKEYGQKSNGAMTVINNVDKEFLYNECKKASVDGLYVDIACYNAPHQFVISGHQEAVYKVEDEVINQSGQVTPLLMSAPFHCRLLKPASDILKEELKKIPLGVMKYPIISNVTALPYSKAEDMIENLYMQITNPVQWQNTMLFLKKKRVTLALELGPQAVLSNLVSANVSEIRTITFGQKNDRENLLKWLQTKENMACNEEFKSTNFVHTVITKCLAIAVCTKNLNWNNDEYEKGVIQPYEKIERMQDELEQKGIDPTMEQMTEALEMLRTVFNTKRVPIDVQIRRFKQIFDETGTRDIFLEFKMP